MDEGQHAAEFIGGGLAGESALPGIADGVFGGSCGISANELCEFFGLLSDDGCIEERECLGGDGGDAAFADALGGFGCIEDGHDGEEFAAFDAEVDAASGGIIEDAGAVHGVIEGTADSEECIADGFCFESSGFEVPEPAIGGIFGEVFRGSMM